MLIDWFTVGAQVLNFLVLAWLLKRFLYKPILDAIDARETKIAAELGDAAARKAEARKERDEFARKNEEFDASRAALLATATSEAGAERKRLVDEARLAADAMSAKRQEALRSDASALNREIRQRTGREVVSVARKALSDLAGASLEERVAEVFIRRLKAMDQKAREGLAAALEAATVPALVRSAFALPAAQREAITKALDESFLMEVPVRFEVAPNIVCGVEFSANGQKLGWSIAEYLASLERGVDDLLNEKVAPNARTVQQDATGSATKDLAIPTPGPARKPQARELQPKGA